MSEATKYKEALNEVIDAWESLRGNRNYSPTDISNWLSRKMAPAINRARKVLDREKPK